MCQDISVKKQESRVVKKEENEWDELMDWSASQKNAEEVDHDVESDYEESELSEDEDENEDNGDNSTKKISVNNGSEKKSDEFPCNMCGKVFKWIESLRHHELKHLRECIYFQF